MDADDLQQLYKLLRGSRSALLVLDAQAMFVDLQMVDAQQKLIEARELYAESRSRLLRQTPSGGVDSKAKDADRQIKRLERKQEKAREVLDAFDELAPQMAKLARREQESKLDRDGSAETESAGVGEPAGADGPADGAPASRSDGDRRDEFIVARPEAVTDEFAESFRRTEGDEQLEVISRHFGFREVSSATDVHSDALYFVRRRGKSFLIRTLAEEPSEEGVPMANALDESPMKPLSLKAMLRLGKKRKMVLLTVKASANDESSSDENPKGHGDDQNQLEDAGQQLLDIGAFSQLLTSAQRSGLVPGAEQIGHVRDREFQMGKYDLAFQTIESLHAQFTSNSNQRVQRLIREDAEIANGQVKISPKDLQAKRARERLEGQEIERARRRFQVVVEGLRVLMNS